MYAPWLGPTVRRLAVALLAVALLIAGWAPAADAQVDLGAVERVELRGVSLRRIAGAPAPLYLGEDVPLHHAAWALEAMRLAWDEAPRLTGLPLPSEEIPVFLFRDRDQFRTQAQQLLRTRAPVGGSGCFTRAPGPDRFILCHAPTLNSRERTIDYITHELTHQLVQGDMERRRGVLTWYNEGLAEYVESAVLAVHGPAYAANDWAQRERRVASALRSDRYLRLEHLSTGQLWRDADDAPLAYAQSALGVRWLVDRFGIDAVVEVVRRTGVQSAFAPAFHSVFGMTTVDFEIELEAMLRTSLGVR